MSSRSGQSMEQDQWGLPRNDIWRIGSSIRGTGIEDKMGFTFICGRTWGYQITRGWDLGCCHFEEGEATKSVDRCCKSLCCLWLLFWSFRFCNHSKGLTCYLPWLFLESGKGNELPSRVWRDDPKCSSSHLGRSKVWRSYKGDQGTTFDHFNSTPPHKSRDIERAQEVEATIYIDQQDAYVAWHEQGRGRICGVLEPKFE